MPLVLKIAFNIRPSFVSGKIAFCSFRASAVADLFVTLYFYNRLEVLDRDFKYTYDAVQPANFIEGGANHQCALSLYGGIKIGLDDCLWPLHEGKLANRPDLIQSFEPAPRIPPQFLNRFPIVGCSLAFATPTALRVPLRAAIMSRTLYTL